MLRIKKSLFRRVCGTISKKKFWYISNNFLKMIFFSREIAYIIYYYLEVFLSWLCQSYSSRSRSALNHLPMDSNCSENIAQAHGYAYMKVYQPCSWMMNKGQCMVWEGRKFLDFFRPDFRFRQRSLMYCWRRGRMDRNYVFRHITEQICLVQSKAQQPWHVQLY